MTTFTWDPQTATKKVEPKVSRAAFGDGYEQRVAQGINSVSAEWSLTFIAEISEVDAIDSFLTARAGIEAFLWTDPRGNTISVVCESWAAVPAQGLRSSGLSATFKQVFGS